MVIARRNKLMLKRISDRVAYSPEDSPYVKSKFWEETNFFLVTSEGLDSLTGSHRILQHPSPLPRGCDQHHPAHTDPAQIGLASEFYVEYYFGVIKRVLLNFFAVYRVCIMPKHNYWLFFVCNIFESLCPARGSEWSFTVIGLWLLVVNKLFLDRIWEIIVFVFLLKLVKVISWDRFLACVILKWFFNSRERSSFYCW